VNAAKSERPFFGRSTAAIAKAPKGSGVIGGDQVGYDRQFGAWIAGFEIISKASRGLWQSARFFSPNG
jgi:hypothetical protein